jgi:DNA-binding CsgD family transcriptional regulator
MQSTYREVRRTRNFRAGQGWTVNAFDVAQTFLKDYRTRTPLGELVVSFQRSLISLGFRSFACWSHVDPLHPPPEAVVLHSYPREWIRRYSDAGLYQVDPVSLWAGRTLVPFRWDDESFCAGLTSAQQAVLSHAARYGIAHGYTVPIHLPHGASTQAGSCTVIPAAAAVPLEHYAVVQLMAPPLFEAARLALRHGDSGGAAESLSERERECLTLAAQGKTDWVAGRILGISEKTVHNHIENAKRRLRVTTRVQAIVQALASRQIALGEVVCRSPGRPVVESLNTLGHPHSHP